MSEGETYNTFIALNSLFAVVEEAPRVPGTGRSMVDSKVVLGLISDIEQSIPADIKHAQEILENHHEIISEAETYSASVRGESDEYSVRLRRDADDYYTEQEQAAAQHVKHAHAKADSIIAAATSQANSIVSAAEKNAAEHVAKREHEGAEIVQQATEDGEQIRQDAGTYYQDAVAKGDAEQQRLVSESVVVVKAREEADSIIAQAEQDSAHVRAEADEDSKTRRAQCDEYISSHLDGHEDFLIKAVEKAREQRISLVSTDFDAQQSPPRNSPSHSMASRVRQSARKNIQFPRG